jgi:hypothetical protein
MTVDVTLNARAMQGFWREIGQGASYCNSWGPIAGGAQSGAGMGAGES